MEQAQVRKGCIGDAVTVRDLHTLQVGQSADRAHHDVVHADLQGGQRLRQLWPSRADGGGAMHYPMLASESRCAHAVSKHTHGTRGGSVTAAVADLSV